MLNPLISKAFSFKNIPHMTNNCYIKLSRIQYALRDVAVVLWDGQDTRPNYAVRTCINTKETGFFTKSGGCNEV